MLLKSRAIYYSDQPLTQAHLARPRPIAGRGQIIRAMVVGLVFAAVFLWALPQYRLSAGVAPPNPQATRVAADAS